MSFWLLQIFNGISFGMLLFLLAAGMSLVFGLMRIFSMVHGSFYLLGGYVGLTAIRSTQSFALALLAAAFVTMVLGAFVERLLLRKLYGDGLRQVLVTFGLLLIIGDAILTIWGGHPMNLPRPDILSGTVELGPIVVPAYRVAVVVCGFAIAALLWLVIEKTRIGAMIRATVDDSEVAQATNVHVSIVYTLVFAFGAMFAGIAGVIGGAFLGLYPGADFEILLLAFVVIVVGGIGSIKGALAGALIVGMIDSFGKVLFPEFALFTLFVPIVAILVFKPTGLFGREIA